MPARPETAPLAVILAGGRGSRIGGAKATVQLAGRALVEYPLSAARQAGLEAWVVGKQDTPLPPLSARVIYEPPTVFHPLCGVLAALDQAGERPILALGCDMPFVSPALLGYLAEQRGSAVAAELDGRLQPFPALYRAPARATLEQAIAGGSSLRRTLVDLDVQTIPERELARFGDPRRLYFSVNTPSDLQTAGAWLTLAS